MNAAALSGINDGRQSRIARRTEFIETNEIPGIAGRQRLRPRPVKMIIISQAVIAYRNSLTILSRERRKEERRRRRREKWRSVAVTIVADFIVEISLKR